MNESFTEIEGALGSLHRSEQRFARLFLNHLAPMVITTVKEGRIINVNARFADLAGYRRDEMIGRTVNELGLWTDSDERAQVIEQLNLESAFQSHVTKMRCKSGELRNLALSVDSIELESEAEPAVIWMAIDITELKRTEELLKAHEQDIGAIADNIPGLVNYIDSEGRLRYINKQHEEWLGAPRSEILGKHYSEVLDAAASQRVSSAMEALRAGQSVRYEAFHPWAHPGPRWAFFNYVPDLDDQGRLKGFYILGIDITERKLLEEALRESDERFHALIEHSSEAIALVDAHGVLRYVSPAAGRLLDFPVQEVLGQSMFKLVHPDDLDSARQTLVRLASEPGSIETAECRVQRKDGTWCWVEAVGTNLLSIPAVHAIVINYRDITARKEAEDALRKSEAQLSNAMKIAKLGDWELDVASGMFTFTDNFYAIFHTNAKEMGGYQMPAAGYAKHFLHPEDAFLFAEEVRKAAETDDPNFNRYLEHRMLYADGSAGHIAVRYFIVKDEKGKTIKTYGVNQDITERKRAEVALRESEEKFHALIEHSSEAIALVNAQGMVLFESPAAQRMLGYSNQELVGKSVLKWIHPDDVDRARQAFVQAASEPDSVRTVECRLQHQDGSWRWIEAVGTNLLHIPVVNAIVLNYRDITERKQAEDALRERERQLRALVSSLDDIVFEVDEQGIYRQVWTADEGLLAVPKSELLGRSLLEASGDGTGRLFQGAVQRVLASGHPETLEYPLHVPTGHRWFLARISPIPGPGGSPHSAAVLVRDVTREKQVEAKVQEQLERLTALREVDQVVASTFDVQMSLNMLLSRAIQLLAVDAVAVLILNPVQNVLEYTAGIGFRTNAIENASPKLGTRLAGAAALERRIVETRTVGNEPDSQLLTDDLKGEGFVSYHGAPLVVKGKVIGVLELFSRTLVERDGDWLDFFSTLAGQAAIMIDDAQLFNDLQTSNAELSLAYDATIEGWSRALDLRDKETEGHTQRVTELTVSLARQFGFPEDELIQIRRGALLHDIGKLGVPDHILLKPDALTEAEWEIMKKHPLSAFELLSPIRHLKSSAIDIPYCHHEKWDGTGYPRGLKGEEIPLAARIFAIVDVWDALRSDRPYRRAWSAGQALDQIRSLSGTQLDPRVVQAFLEMVGDS